MKTTAFRLAFLFIIFVAFAAAGHAQSAGSAPIYEVKFVKGVYVKKGMVSPPSRCLPTGPTDCGSGDSTRVSIKGAKGERIRIVLTSDTGGAIFSIHNPNGGPLKNGASATSWTGTLPFDGYFVITVYTNKYHTPFTLKVFNH